MVNGNLEYLGLCKTSDKGDCMFHCLATDRPNLIRLLEKYINRASVHKELLPALWEATLDGKLLCAQTLYACWVAADQDASSAKAKQAKQIDTLERTQRSFVMVANSSPAQCSKKASNEANQVPRASTLKEDEKIGMLEEQAQLKYAELESFLMTKEVIKDYLDMLRGSRWLGQHTAFLYAKCRGFDGHPTRVDIYRPLDRNDPTTVDLMGSFVPDAYPESTYLLLYGRNMQHYSLLCKLTPVITTQISATHYAIEFKERQTMTGDELVVSAARLDERTIAEYENRNGNDKLDHSGRSFTSLLLFTLPDLIPHTSYLTPHTSYLIPYTSY